MDLGFRLIWSITLALLLSSWAGGIPGLTPESLGATVVAATSTSQPHTATTAPTLTPTPPSPLSGDGGGVIASLLVGRSGKALPSRRPMRQSEEAQERRMRTQGSGWDPRQGINQAAERS